MSKIGVIDADFLNSNTRFPNLALMKISGHYNADLINYEQVADYDHVYLSKVFESTNVPEDVLEQSNLNYGGTGFYFDNADPLPAEIEHTMPNYTLYHDYVDKKPATKYYFDTSIGFTTRGCFRQCPFCVNRNATKSVKWSDLDEFVNPEHKRITLLDDNILACKDRTHILQALGDYNKPFEYKQGLDIRLINNEIAKILIESKYYKDFVFAFDDYANKDLIIPKFDLWTDYESSIGKNTKIYLLCAYKSIDLQDICELFERIRILFRYKFLPYVMRYKNWENSEYRGMYITITRWCNQPSLVKKKSFREFCQMFPDHYAPNRYLREFENRHPEVAAKYFDMRFGE